MTFMTADAVGQAQTLGVNKSQLNVRRWDIQPAA
jgi:hypothetical protein